MPGRLLRERRGRGQGYKCHERIDSNFKHNQAFHFCYNSTANGKKQGFEGKTRYNSTASVELVISYKPDTGFNCILILIKATFTEALLIILDDFVEKKFASLQDTLFD